MDHTFVLLFHTHIIDAFIDFFHSIYKNGLKEDNAIAIMKPILSAVDYLHSNNIWHGDIKINNILLFDSILNNTNDSENITVQQNADNTNNTSSSTSENSSNCSIIPKSFTNILIAVLSDFVFAKIFSPGEKSTDYIGTLKYVDVVVVLLLLLIQIIFLLDECLNYELVYLLIIVLIIKTHQKIN